MEEHTHDEENVCPTCLMAGMESARNRILGVVKELSSICDSALPDGGNEAYSDGIIEGWFDLRDKIVTALEAEKK